MQKVLVANRGAIARRIVRACHEAGLQSVVVYSDADAGAPYLAEATQAIHLEGTSAQDTYLNQDLLLRTMRDTRSDALHPGYGFLAENAVFAQRVIDQGDTFVGPQPRWLASMGNKVAARRLFAEQGFPVFPGSELVEDVDAAIVAANEIGFPVLVKPAGGGGGMGMEVVADSTALEMALGRARAIAESAFSDSGVYLERWIAAPRHIEFQILADGRGGAVHAFERECSVQRRNQKLIEETPAPGIDSAQVLDYAKQAAAVSGLLGYDNVGTLETLFTASGEVGFLEMNTRIQVEHAVTEVATGLDLVGLQLSLADGGTLPDEVSRHGYAMEARIYAEDPETLLPSTGKLVVFRPPRLHGVRVETGFAEGQVVTPYYDAMLAKVIAHGTTREMAIGRLLVALRAFEIKGVTSNVALLERVLGHDDFLAGRVDTGILSRVMGAT